MTCVRKKLATRKISCERAPEAKNASVSTPTPRRVTTYHGISIASTALQSASAPSVRLNLINLENRPVKDPAFEPAPASRTADETDESNRPRRRSPSSSKTDNEADTARQYCLPRDPARPYPAP